MQIRYSLLPIELEFIGTRKNYESLAEMLDSGIGKIVATSENDPAPYQYFANVVTINIIFGRKVSFALDQLNHEVVITGDKSWLALLADNIKNFGSDADFDSHLHVDYFEGHFYLEAGSVPLICCLKP